MRGKSNFFFFSLYFTYFSFVSLEAWYNAQQIGEIVLRKYYKSNSVVARSWAVVLGLHIILLFLDQGIEVL